MRLGAMHAFRFPMLSDCPKAFLRFNEELDLAEFVVKSEFQHCLLRKSFYGSLTEMLGHVGQSFLIS